MARARGRGKYSSTLQSGAVNLILVFLIVRDRAIQILLSVSFFLGGGNTYNVVKYFLSKENTGRLANYFALTRVNFTLSIYSVFWGGD